MSNASKLEILNNAFIDVLEENKEYVDNYDISDKISSYISKNLYVNAKDYGAVGDATTDDTEAIKNAILAAINSGLKLYVPEGEYRIGTITIADKSYFEMYGAGQGKTLFKAIDGLTKSNAMFHFKQFSYSKFHDFSIDGNIDVNADGDDQDGIHMFDIWESENINISNVTFQNNVYVGTRVINSKSIIFDHCKAINVDVGIATLGSTCEDIQVLSCYIDGHAKSEGIAMFCTTKIKDVIIRDNIVINKENGQGIRIGSESSTAAIECDNIHIEDNKIENTAVGIACGNQGSYSTNIFITGNVISTRADSRGNGINLGKTKGGFINNNVVNTASAWGIYVSDSSDISVVDNKIYNWQACAISGSNSAIGLSNVTNSVISHNLTRQSQGSDYSGIVLSLAGNTTYNVITDNLFMPSESKTSCGINVSSSYIATVINNYFNNKYCGALISISGLDLVSNTFLLKGYVHKIVNSMQLYNRQYLENIKITVSQSSLELDTELGILHEGAIKKIIIVSENNTFVLNDTDNQTWLSPGEYEAGTYYFKLECINGHWYEMFSKTIA